MGIMYRPVLPSHVVLQTMGEIALWLEAIHGGWTTLYAFVSRNRHPGQETRVPADEPFIVEIEDHSPRCEEWMGVDGMLDVKEGGKECLG